MESGVEWNKSKTEIIYHFVVVVVVEGGSCWWKREKKKDLGVFCARLDRGGELG